jgi:hypothetical protein
MVLSLEATPDAWRLTSRLLVEDDAAPSRHAALPPADAGPMEILRLAPDDAILAVAHRSDKAALWRAGLASLMETNPQAARQAEAFGQQAAAMLGVRDFERDLLGTLGDDLLFYAVPGPERRPPAVALAIEVKPESPVPQAVRTIAGSLVTVHTLDMQGKEQSPHVRLVNTTYKGVPMTTVAILKGDAAGLLAPTLCRAGDYLVVASTDDAARAAVDAFATRTTFTPPAARDGAFMLHADLDVPGLNALLAKHKQWLVEQKMRNEGVDELTALREWQNLQFLLGLFDRVTVTAARAPGRIDRELRIGLDRGPLNAE